MPRRIFAAGSVTNATGAPLRLEFYPTSTSIRREADLWTIDGSNNLLERIPNGVIITDSAGAYSAFAGPDDLDTLYALPSNTTSRTTLTGSSTNVPGDAASTWATPAVSTTLTGTLAAWVVTAVDCTAGAGARTLPAANAVSAGTAVSAKKADTSSNNLVVSRAGSDLIYGTGSGATSKTLSLAGEAVEFVSNGVNKWTIRSSDTPSGVLAATYAQVVALTGSGIDLTGATDSVTALNVLLAANAGKVLRGIPGSNYLISAPLVVPSGATLDMTGCTVTLKAAANCNMVQNTAVATSNRVVTDAAINSSSTSLTSATAAFTSADTGRSIVVAGALPTSGFGGGNSAVGPLCATMTYVNATTVTLSVAAGATVTGATATIYDRDSRIEIRGGTWARGTVAGTALQLHALRFRRVDDLRIRDVKYTATSGNKYAVNVGDVTNFTIDNINLTSASDGIHVNGPASRGVISRIFGTTGDDFVALTARDYGAYEDTAGDITDIKISTLIPTSSAQTCKLLAGANAAIKRIAVRDCVGASFGMVLDTDGTVSGIADDILIDGFDTVGGVGINVSTPTVSRLTIRSLSMTYASNSSYGVSINSGVTVTSLLLDGFSHSGAGTGNGALALTGTVTSAELNNIYFACGSSSYVYRHQASSASCTSLRLSGVYVVGGGGFLNTFSQGTLTAARLVNCFSTGASWLGDIATSTVIHAHGVTNASQANGSYNLRATAVVTHYGSGNVIGGSITSAGGYALRVKDLTFTLDISKVTAPASGDVAQNTASASGVLPGAGPVIYDGSAWKRSDLGGVVKQGTATLSGGTVTVSDTAVTTTTKIRVYPKTLGGTPGALYISALTASTSFVITSTSNTDTSLVQYDIVQY